MLAAPDDEALHARIHDEVRQMMTGFPLPGFDA